MYARVHMCIRVHASVIAHMHVCTTCARAHMYVRVHAHMQRSIPSGVLTSLLQRSAAQPSPKTGFVRTHFEPLSQTSAPLSPNSHPYIHTCTRMRTRVYACAHSYTRTRAHMHTCTHIRACTRVHAHALVHTRTYGSCVRTCVHVHACTCVRVRTYARQRQCFPFWQQAAMHLVVACSSGFDDAVSMRMSASTAPSATILVCSAAVNARLSNAPAALFRACRFADLSSCHHTR